MSGLSTDGRNDEAVRRLREESARRIAREARWRTFAAWCAVVTLAGGVSLAAVGALDARQAQQAAQAAEENERVARAQASACQALTGKLAATTKELNEKLAWARSEKERAGIRAAALQARAAAIAGQPTRCSGAPPARPIRWVKRRGCVLGGDDPLDGL